MFKTIKVPGTEEEMVKTAFELCQAAHELGLEIDRKMFLQMWAGGTRVVVEIDEKNDNKIVSLGFLVVGKRWYDSFTSGTLMAVRGNVEGIIDYTKGLCEFANVHSLFYETNEVEPISENENKRVIIEYLIK